MNIFILLGIIAHTVSLGTVLTLSGLLFPWPRLKQKVQGVLIEYYNDLCLILLGIKVEFVNRELYKADEACVIISNHSSFADIPAIYQLARGRLRMLAKRELFYVPFMGWSLWASDFVSVNRGRRASGAAAQRLLEDRLQRGYQLYLAPEGTRSFDGKLLPFKSGAFRIAFQNQVPIVVVALEKPWEIIPKHSIFNSRGGTIKATLLGKISPFLIDEKGEKHVKKVDVLISEARKLYLAHGFEESTSPVKIS